MVEQAEQARPGRQQDGSYRTSRPGRGGWPSALWSARSWLAVVAHPDDESFGLGGVLAALVAAGRDVDLLVLSAGENFTAGDPAELARIRAREVASAAGLLGLRRHWLDTLPDGALASLPRGELAARIRQRIGKARPDALITLDRTGVTGHPDHRAVSEAALGVAAAAGLPAWEWGLPSPVAGRLTSEFGIAMHGLSGGEQVTIRAGRPAQWRAIRAHASQSPGNPLLARRLELLGDTETLRLTRPPVRAQLTRFTAEAARLARPGAGPDDRRELLGALIRFASVTDIGGWPPEYLTDDLRRPYAAHCLHDDRGWSLAAIITHQGSATPPHDHGSWGAAAVVAGAERNLRFAGACPDHLRLAGEEVVPAGGGYLFDGGDVHQAADAAQRTVSVHLLVKDGEHDAGHCPEPGTGILEATAAGDSITTATPGGGAHPPDAV
jgi:LmbE family N-acetylglucosaminyl deacetylase